MWFLEQLHPELPVNNVTLAYELSRPLDKQALARSLREVVARHAALRTTIRNEGGVPVAEVVPPGEATIELAELRFVSSQPQDLEAEALAAFGAEARRPIALDHAPLLRASLGQVADNRHLLLLVIHHIAADAWSTGVLLDELAALYTAFAHAKPSPLPPVTYEYPHHAASERQRVREATTEIEFWREWLRNRPADLRLPHDRSRAGVQGFHGDRFLFSFDRRLSERVHAAARDLRATPFVFFLAAFGALLSRLSGQGDVAVGTVVSGRDRIELESLVGLVANTVPIRVPVARASTFKDVVAGVRKEILGALAHGWLPFQQIVELADLDRNVARTPLFDVMFAFHNPRTSAWSLGDVDAAPIAIETKTAKYDLTLTIWDGAVISGAFEYSTGLFTRETVERLANQLEHIIAAATADAQAVVREIELLAAAERESILVTWNNTTSAFADARTVQELIEAQAAATPKATAVWSRARTMTYAELNDAAARLAATLVERGARPESIVGVYVERCPELVVALLAALKTGAAVLPLDPDLPADRIAFMLADSAPVTVVTGPGANEGLAGPSAVEVGDLGSATSMPALRQHLDTAAYVLYTSGSTGEPKGVVNTHRGLLNRLQWAQTYLPLGGGDVVLQKTPISFDVSMWEFLWPLMVGARLALAEPGGHRDALGLVDVVVDAGVTLAHFVPSLLDVFSHEPSAERCTSLRDIIASGENLTPASIERLWHVLPHVRVHNLYGPTEAAIDVTAWTVPSDRRLESVPIGRPIANMQTYVLDEQLEPVPVGVVGELWLSGVGLARGYLGRPRLTSERFVPHPHGESGARLYRTGDRARWRGDGSIEFVGRVDDQVKIRGQRIELGEIEAVLERETGATRVVAIVHEFERLGPAIVAYVMGAAIDDVVALRMRLRRVLPDVMIPATFMSLESVPLTPTGKVDRRALPLPDRDGAASERPSAEVGGDAPATPTERVIATVFQELLDLPVGRRDSFFALGGNSLAATRAAARLAHVFGVLVPVRLLFDEPSVQDLARAVEGLPAAGSPERAKVPTAGGTMASPQDRPMPDSHRPQAS